MSKFKYIERYLDCNPESFQVPESLFLPLSFSEKFDINLENAPYILRSELIGEGEEKLLAGESLSLRDICTFSEFKRSFQKVVEQKNISKVVLQKQISHKYHLTGISYQNHIFLEVRSKENVFYSFLSNGFHVGFSLPWSKLERSIEEFQDREFMLFEMGLVEDEIPFLYQLTEISEPVCRKILRNGYFKKIFKNIIYFEKPLSLLSMLMLLIRSKFARLSRFQKQLFDPINNWNFIMFYFALYCYIKKNAISEVTLASFYLWSRTSGHWIANCSFEHIKIANKFSNTIALDADIKGGENIFIGEGVISKNIIFCESLDPSFISKLTEKSLLLTMDKSLLGHGYLSAIEYGHCVVGNLSKRDFVKYRQVKKILVDFNHKEINII